MNEGAHASDVGQRGRVFLAVGVAGCQIVAERALQWGHRLRGEESFLDDPLVEFVAVAFYLAVPWFSAWLLVRLLGCRRHISPVAIAMTVLYVQTALFVALRKSTSAMEWLRDQAAQGNQSEIQVMSLVIVGLMTVLGALLGTLWRPVLVRNSALTAAEAPGHWPASRNEQP